MKKLSVIKIGGKVIDDQALLGQFLQDFAELEGPKILVHGGGKIASDFGKRLGIQPKMVEGRRITDSETLELVTMVYGGLVNKKIVSHLQALGEDAIGLSGADANVLKATKRPVKTIDYGFAGDITIEGVNKSRISQFLENGLIPVICALTHDGSGSLLNTNADTLASVISGALSSEYEVRLTYCFEHKGVLSDFEKQKVIATIDIKEYESLKANGIISDGMIPKLDNAFEALKSGASAVTVGHFSDLQAMCKGNSGTLIEMN
ncbi:acetylglutamate kinase [Roseivirga sp. E12]|uniref:acetylglutamate kinase n=1 Tax=Roseivirga sp. E12 TaxID=2819237 RepID=UPI001ABC81F9|nr:acetylglutamate kinase [Roseivirga sp. E12]MBO3700769.1 acetylglutamate kinase [Roseivirga sp. E12]